LKGLGLAVTQLRSERNMTREAVVKKGGLTGNTITHIEKGQKQEPRWATVRGLAKGLGVPTEDLVTLAIELAPGTAGERLRQRERKLIDRQHRCQPAEGPEPG
jgi:transcriptional regulator with XRE-family HTH domain